MKNKRLLYFLLLVFCICILNGCDKSNKDTVVISNQEELYAHQLGIGNLVYIQDYLYYDDATRIVYFWNGRYNGNRVTMPSTYYAPNGKPYKYNPDIHTFEVIE